MSILDRIKNAWNVFRSPESHMPIMRDYYSGGGLSTTRVDRARFSPRRDRTLAVPIYNRIALDVASLDFKHIKVDEQGNYLSEIKSTLNDVLTVEANIDQTYKEFLQDIVMSLLDEGCVAIVPIDTSDNIRTGNFDIYTMRTAKILEWYPRDIKVRIYNERKGQKEDIIVPKKSVAIVENPLYAVINEPNSTQQRLIRKLQLLDATDDKTYSGNLNMIIQLPYVIRSEKQKEQAEARRKEIEKQLMDSKYGIAYTDGTEKIVQLGHAIENKLLDEIDYLQKMLYAQLGLTENVLNGSATEEQYTQYYERTIGPIAEAICAEFRRKFLTKTARTQGQSIKYFRDPFKIAGLDKITKAADTFTRNEIMTSNEIRQKIGMRPSGDPKASQLRNSNLSRSLEQEAMDRGADPMQLLKQKEAANGMPLENQNEGNPQEQNIDLTQYETVIDKLESLGADRQDIIDFIKSGGDPNEILNQAQSGGG